MVTTCAGHAKKRAAELAASARLYQHPPSYDHDVDNICLLFVKSWNNVKLSRLFSSVKIGTVPLLRLGSTWLRILLFPLSHQAMMRRRTTWWFEGVSARVIVIGENWWSRHKCRVNCYICVMSVMSIATQIITSLISWTARNQT